ncbi:MAG: hypothetical protein HOC74_03620 [Gemmatimonadetes bacterium]|nr:hypothetical protein [Gemmatimonadota bacterium]
MLILFADSERWMIRFLSVAALMASAVLLLGCAASTGGAGSGFPPIPEGKGRIILETGGINEVNFYVLDEEDEEIYSETPRMPGSSPIGYERAGIRLPQFVDLAAGSYTLVVNTDIRDSVELFDIQVPMGEMRYVQIPIGRFQLLYFAASAEGGQERRQVPFLIYDYNMSTVLGKGMTSTEVRYFILPVGTYKVRLENSSTGIDEIRPVQVGFGRPQNLSIAPQQAPETPGEEGEATSP